MIAILNGENVCTLITDDETMKGIKFEGASVLGKQYDFESETWLDVPNEEPTVDEILAEVLLNQADILAKQADQEEIDGELLLGQTEILLTLSEG